MSKIEYEGALGEDLNYDINHAIKLLSENRFIDLYNHLLIMKGSIKPLLKK